MSAKGKSVTHVLLVIDMSGSMEGLADDVRGGFNSYIEDLREQDGRFRVTATVFDTEFIPLCVAAKLKDVPVMTAGNYSPRGMTALLDAIGKTIVEFEAKTTLAGDDRVLVVVNTDGFENSSREFGGDRIAEMIRTRETTKQWMFVYMGAGPHAWGQGQNLGFAHTIDTDHSAAGTHSTYSGIGVGTRSYAAGASAAETLREVKTEATKTN